MPALHFIVPGPIDQLTGGYLFDRRLVEGLRDRGWTVDLIELAGQFPFADEQACRAAERACARCADEACVVIDGLALPAFQEALPRHADRLRVVGFVHHPLSLETGLSGSAREALAKIEARLWPMLRGIVCPSADSARAVSSCGVPAERIAITPPGTDAVQAGEPFRNGTLDAADPVVRLLAVGTVTARKGHLLLIEALAALDPRLAWQLDCIGSLERDAATVEALRSAIARTGLGSRVSLYGEVPRARLDQAYGQADLFVLPSWHEGYGMVFAEALAWGLPVIATTGGALPEVVPPSAGRLVAPGDRQALSRALAELLGDAALRRSLSMGAREAARRLPDWQQATGTWIEAVMRIAK